MIRKHQRFFNFTLLALDAITLAASYLACYLYKKVTDPLFSPDALYLKILLWMVPLILIIYFFMEAYTAMRNRTFRKEMLIIIRAHLISVVLVYSVFFGAKMVNYSREIFFSFGLVSLLFMLVERYAVRRLMRYLREIGYNQKHMLVIGAGEVGLEFARKVTAHRDFGYNVIGFLHDEEDNERVRETDLFGRPVLGKVDDLPDVLGKTMLDEVVVALPYTVYPKYFDIIDSCEKEGVRVRIAIDYYKNLPRFPKIEDFDGIPLLNTRYIPLDDPFNRCLKRVVDIVFSFAAIVVLAPVMAVVAIGVKLTSPGPVLFKLERVGLQNKPFKMLKFRSMRVMDDTNAATEWTTAEDPRKTRFGSLIRRLSLDELPQFFNVLFGSMSVVGPRPERPFFVEQFKESVPKYMIKHRVKPGITGWAQVNGWRGDTSIDKRIECDIYYIENWDILFDLKIMFLTIYKGLFNKNAY